MPDKQPEKQQAARLQELATEAGFDTDNLGIVSVLRALLNSVKDEGTGIDTGGGRDSADLWVTIANCEYFITVRKSNNQIAKESN